MEQYIKKSALVAEIERRGNICKKVVLDLRTKENQDYYQGKAEAYKEVLDLLDTLEVKEVDIEKKKMEWIEQLCKYFKANYLYVSGHESFISDFRSYAKDLK